MHDSSDIIKDLHEKLDCAQKELREIYMYLEEVDSLQEQMRRLQIVIRDFKERKLR